MCYVYTNIYIHKYHIVYVFYRQIACDVYMHTFTIAGFWVGRRIISAWSWTGLCTNTKWRILQLLG